MRKTLVPFLGGLALVAAMALPAGALPAANVHHGGGGSHGGHHGSQPPRGPHRSYEPGHGHPGGHGRYRWGPNPGVGYPCYGADCQPMNCPNGSL